MSGSATSFKTEKIPRDTQNVRAAAEADLQQEKMESMSIGKFKKKENPRVLKPLPSPNSSN